MQAILKAACRYAQPRQTVRTALQTNIQNTQSALRKGDLAHAENHLALAQSNANEAKKEITAVGRETVKR